MKTKLSKGIMKYALDNNINKAQLESSIKDIIPNIYFYKNEAFLLNEIDEYYVNNRTKLFSGDGKNTFWLIMDALANEEVKIEIQNRNQIIPCINENSDAESIYSFLKNKLFALNNEFYNDIILRNLELVREEYHYSGFTENLFNELFDFLKIEKIFHERIFELFENFLYFDYAAEDFYDEEN